MKLTVMYDGQFWVGILEALDKDKLKAARFIFGPEPKDPELLEFVNREMINVMSRVNTAIKVEAVKERKINPKRMIRETQKEIAQRSVSSKAQQAIQEELESRKKERKVVSKQQKEEIKEYKRETARQKAKEKHRGR